MRKTIIVNLFGGPCCGKSTCAAWLFSQLKIRGVDCEYVTEFAKDKVWEQNDEVFKCQFYISGKQAFKISRCFGKVDVIITDSPIAIGTQYCDNESLRNAILYEFNKYGDSNLNVLLKRFYRYEQNGRNQSEEEAKHIDETTEQMLNGQGIPYVLANGNEDGYSKILNKVLNKLEENGN